MFGNSRYVLHTRCCVKELIHARSSQIKCASILKTKRVSLEGVRYFHVNRTQWNFLSLLRPQSMFVPLPKRVEIVPQRTMGGGPRTTPKTNHYRKPKGASKSKTAGRGQQKREEGPQQGTGKVSFGKKPGDVDKGKNPRSRRTEQAPGAEKRNTLDGGKKKRKDSGNRGTPKAVRQLENFVRNLEPHAGTVRVVDSAGSNNAEVIVTLQLPRLHGLPNPLQIREVGHVVNACEKALKMCRNRQDAIARQSDLTGIASDMRAKTQIPKSAAILATWMEANQANLSSQVHVNPVTKGLVHVELGMTFRDNAAGRWIAERLGSQQPKWYCLHYDGDRGRNRVAEVALMDLQAKAGLDLDHPGPLPGTMVDLTKPSLEQARQFLDMIASGKISFTTEQVGGGRRRHRHVWEANVSIPVRTPEGEISTLSFEGQGHSQDKAVDNAIVVGAQSVYEQLNTGSGEDAVLRRTFSHALDAHRRVLGLPVPFVSRPLKHDIQHLLNADVGAEDSGLHPASQWLSTGDRRTERGMHAGSGGRRRHGQGGRGALSPLRHELVNVQLLEEVVTRGERQPALTAIRDALPITALRDDLHRELQDHRVIVVSGGTGSGKTTQIPQYILDDAIRNNKGTQTNVIVTQPRRIAAVSVATRVAHERGEKVGGTVGYRVRHHSKPAREYASIEFCTTGVLLRSLQDDPMLANASHVIVDEVHERDVSTDFLLMKLKDLLREHPNRDLKVILMSATLDAEAFSTYFGGAPLIEVPSATRFPVEEIYLEDLEARFDGGWRARELIGGALQYETDLLQGQRQRLEAYAEQEQEKLREVQPSGSTNATATSAARMHGTDATTAPGDAVHAPASTLGERLAMAERDHATLLADVGVSTPARKKKGDQGATYKVAAWLLQELVKENMDASAPHPAPVPTDGSDTPESARGACAPPATMGSVLCFLPGWENIKEIRRLLEESPLKRHMKVIALHSTVPQGEQQAAFEPAPPGVTKIILATNIAESSVTIDDAVAVVDCGRVKELNYNPHRRMSTLDTLLASQASATQRRGRAGRVGPGKCYRLFSRPVFAAMADRSMPEILRMELQQTCLLTKALMPSTPVQVSLQKAMNPPLSEHIALALDRLQNLGAISAARDSTDEGETDPHSNSDEAIAAAGSQRGQAASGEHASVLSDTPMEDLSPIERLQLRIARRGLNADAEIGASPFVAPSLQEDGERMTYLGQRLVSLPLDPMVGKMLMLGATFGCTTPIATVAACYAAQSPFVPAAALRQQATRSKIGFNESSDVFAAVEAYGEWQKQRADFGYRAAADWAFEHNLVQSSLQGIENVQKQLVHELSRIGYFTMRDYFNEEPDDVAGPNRRSDDEALVKSLSIAGVSANIACKSSLPNHTVLQTTVDSRVDIHPGSLNNPMWRNLKQGRVNPFWYAYSTKIMNANQVTLRDTTACLPLDVMLFGGFKLHREESEIAGVCGRLDDYMVCCGFQDDFDNIHLLRRALDDVFLRRVQSPRLHAQAEMFERDEQVLDVVADVVNGHHLRKGFHQLSTPASVRRGTNHHGLANQSPPSQWSSSDRRTANGTPHAQGGAWTNHEERHSEAWGEGPQRYSQATRSRDPRADASASTLTWSEAVHDDAYGHNRS
eukprot:m.113547 g.113547  ORF g.113547 m.113547 type:complete len:1630 (+) comp17088_c0_seq1:99-4988(+)